MGWETGFGDIYFKGLIYGFKSFQRKFIEYLMN
jgi:hypothetical protein